MTEKKINQLRHCIMAYDGIQDTVMLMKFYSLPSLVHVSNLIIKQYPTEDEFVKGARQLILEVEAIKPIEDYPELWI